jgi:hypothetical protein
MWFIRILCLFLIFSGANALARLASDHFPLGSLLAVAGELTLKLKNE